MPTLPHIYHTCTVSEFLVVCDKVGSVHAHPNPVTVHVWYMCGECGIGYFSWRFWLVLAS